MIALSDFDPVIVERYGITEEKLAQVVRYVRLLQGQKAESREVGRNEFGYHRHDNECKG